jgi:apolipoprotein D and lipocalin family protein
VSRAFVVRLLLMAFAALCTSCGSDAPLDVASNVDLSRIQGKWYEIARLPRATQTDCHGTTAFYTRGPDGTFTLVNQCNTGSAAGPLRTVAMTATVPDPSTPAKLALDIGGIAGDYWIVEIGTDYEYAVIGHPSRAYLWILSRTPALDPGVVQGILDRAKARRFDTTQLLYTPQPPPDDRMSLDVPEGTVPPTMSHGCSTSRAGVDDAGGALVVMVFAWLLWRVRRHVA